MPIRQMQAFTTLVIEQPTAIGARRRLLEEHQTQVQQRLQELQQHLAVIETKIQFYQDLESKQLTQESS
ncbi:hypothetical protein [Candidatus Cyanaurora vandensis]|uniref:hypothetical protein n=1 Tax=Candidatus Cyanaurora vandensis TaxID=2714958 RepID=UPI00257BF440|nr:hypothetical protein [Candidatus Cyanaurora vandensis]